jgi:hypothetical protein
MLHPYIAVGAPEASMQTTHDVKACAFIDLSLHVEESDCAGLNHAADIGWILQKTTNNAKAIILPKSQARLHFRNDCGSIEGAQFRKRGFAYQVRSDVSSSMTIPESVAL